MLTKTILCATDGLPHSDRALGRAADMAHEARAELHVVHIAEHEPGEAALGGELAAERRLLQRDRVKRIRETLEQLGEEDPGVGIIPHFLGAGRGTVAAQIARMADAIDADLIVIGSRGRGPIRAAIASSTAQRLPRETKRPVLVLAGDGPTRRTPAGGPRTGMGDRTVPRRERRPAHA